MNKKEMVCYLYDRWQIDKSDSYFKCIINPLREYTKLDLKMFSFDEFLNENNKIIILQLITLLIKDDYRFKKHVEKNENNNSYFLTPMWDWVCEWDENAWNMIPKNIKIISFCKKISEITKKYGFKNILDIKYFHKPYDIVNFTNNNRVLAYWNRSNLYSKEYLIKVSEYLNINQFLYLEKLDPDFSKQFDLPNKIKNTEVVTFRNWNTSQEYHNIIKPSNIFLCPRLREGIGVAFLEQFSRGSVCFSFNETNMNEYIRHNQNGYLFKSLDINNISWSQINKLNLENLSKNSIECCEEGFKNWENDLIRLNRFLKNEN